MIKSRGGKLYTRSGLIINTNAPWLTSSPDAFVKIDKKFTLVEVKCPLVGETSKGAKFLNSVNFIYNDSGTFVMRKKSINYAQIQLGLALANLQNGKLVIYCKRDDSIHVINVDYDDQFTENLLTKLRSIYFKYYLPFLYLHREKLHKVKYNYWTLDL